MPLVSRVAAHAAAAWPGSRLENVPGIIQGGLLSVRDEPPPFSGRSGRVRPRRSWRGRMEILAGTGLDQSLPLQPAANRYTPPADAVGMGRVGSGTSVG